MDYELVTQYSWSVKIINGGAVDTPHDGLAARAAVVCTSNGTVALADRSGRETGSVTSSGSSSAFAGFRFPRAVIAMPVR